MKGTVLLAISAAAVAGAAIWKKYQPFKVQSLVGQLPTNGAWPLRDISAITDITIHHTAGSATEKPSQLAQGHIDEKGWPGIGYHFLVYQDGAIYQVNDIAAHSYHNGFNNGVAIGISMPGNFEDNPTIQRQLDAALWLCNDLKKRYPQIRFLMGHKEYEGSTLCPGKNVLIDGFRANTGLQVNPAGKIQQSAISANSESVKKKPDADN